MATRRRKKKPSRNNTNSSTPVEVSPQTQEKDAEQTRRFFKTVAITFAVVVAFFALLQFLR